MNALAAQEERLQAGPPATSPRADESTVRLLLLDVDANAYSDRRIGDLPLTLNEGDLMVVNDAATLPGSLRGVGPAGQALEIRLAAQLAEARWSVVLFGAGDWRTPTELRAPPPRLQPGDTLFFGAGPERLVARVVSRSGRTPRLLEVEFDVSGGPFLHSLYRWGRPVQYSYLDRDLELWDVQTTYAARPWAAEQPSAGRPLRWNVLRGLAHRGVTVVPLTHAAGLSSTGDPELDALLPLAERFEIPEPTVTAIASAHRMGARVIAVGTSVVRALEGSALQYDGVVKAGAGQTDLIVGPGFRPRVVDGLLTGLHDPVGTHFALLRAFAPEGLLESAYRHARDTGYLWHEFGDSSLIVSCRRKGLNP
jgi:S-adenosylmethionine:tRNA ribosyltransferase-isomerase